jgi:hypothetical protein
MNVVRNLVFMTSTAAIVSFGLLAAVLFTPPTPPTPGPPSGKGNGGGINNGNGNPTGGTSATNPALPAGAQLAFGAANNVTAPTVTGNPQNISDAAGGIQTGSSNLFPSDYAANYAATSATLLQTNIENLRAMGGFPPLAYDPILGKAAANLVADILANGTGFPTQGTAINSKGQTPIQQVKAVSPTSTATSVSVLSFASDALTTAEALDPQTGLTPAENSFATDPNQIPFNSAWTHYGFAVVTVPTVNGQHNALRYYVIFYAKEG